MHCSNAASDCSTMFLKSPSVHEVEDRTNCVPKCKECGQDMKPHCMFFDENYSEKFYRKETVDAYLETIDCLIVIGTALETNFAKRIVIKALDKLECPVIEINLQSSVNGGFNLKVLEKSEKAV
jgi:NAD-dependent SIR2 family protein deacetylase